MVQEAIRRVSLSNFQINEDKKPFRHWTRENCYKEAQKYKSRKEFAKNNQPAYQASRKNGWLEDYTWFQKLKGQWDKEACYKEAKKYKTRKDFMRGSGSAYDAARRNGWIDDYTWISPSKTAKKWNKEACYNEAKKYKSRVEFARNNQPAYCVARKNGWLEDYTWFQSRVISDKNTYVVYCYKDEETNSIYVGLTNNMKLRHKQHCNGLIVHGERKYDIVYRYFHSIGKEPPEPIILKKELSSDDAQHYEGYYVELFNNEGMNVLNLAKTGSLGGYGKWTNEKCYDEAKKYDTLLDFRNNSTSAYVAAKRNGWLKDYIWLERLNGFWTREKCAEEAKKYKSRKDFSAGAGSAYQAALRNGWLDDYTWFVSKYKPMGYWNRENCYKEAKKYKSRKEFGVKNGAAYRKARINGWLDDYTWFKSSRNKSGK